VSGSEFGKRAQQHANVIKTAKKLGVKQVVYTSITRAPSSSNPIAPEHKTTEETLTSSGLDYSILRNNWYTDNYLPDIQHAGESGVIAAAVENGRVASATRREYAQAAARVLLGQGHENKIYELSGPVWNYHELAAAASAVLGKEVVFKTISKEDKTKALVAAGFDENLAEFFALVDQSIEAGSLDIESSDLEGILGRKPLNLKAAITSLV
jgi:NAD(P)H dehydrogenase (quinone)